MSAETPREYLKRTVKALLPTGWVYKDGSLPDTIQKVTVTQFLRGAAFNAEAPISGALDADFVLVVVVPETLYTSGPLEDALLDLLFALRKTPNVSNVRAERSEFGFEVSLTLLTQP